MAKEDPKQEGGTRTDQDAKEKRMKVRAKEYLVIYGVAYAAGNIVELPEREALGLISYGQAEQIPEGESAQSESGTAEQVAEATHVASEPEHEDKKKAKQLEEQAQKSPPHRPKQR
jgi:hypothetical protein